jgi:replicative DNA helicase
MSYEEKSVKRIIEQYYELSEQAQQHVIDQIRYEGLVNATKEIAKAKTYYFGELYADAIERQKTFFSFEGMTTGLEYFDEGTMGLRGGETIVIAGPSNLGKTMVALNIVAQTVVNNNVPCLIISMEMPARDIASRLYNMTPRHGALMENVIIQAELDVNTRHIEAMIKRHQPKLLMLDHIQFLSNQEKAKSDYERIDAAVKKMQRIAINYDIPIIMISHVAKTRSGKDGKASANDLKGNSAIEQDSDIVFMLNRTDEQRQNGTLTVELVKQRKKGSKVYFRPAELQFNGVVLSGNYMQNEVRHEPVKAIGW